VTARARARRAALCGVLAGCGLLLGVSRPAAACRDDALVRELRDSGDDFRAVTVLRAQELEARGTPRGLECARLILGAYLRHGELDLVDDWVTRLGRSYAPLLPANAGFRVDGTLMLDDSVTERSSTGNSTSLTRTEGCCYPTGGSIEVARSDGNDENWSFGPNCGDISVNGHRVTPKECF